MIKESIALLFTMTALLGCQKERTAEDIHLSVVKLPPDIKNSGGQIAANMADIRGILVLHNNCVSFQGIGFIEASDSTQAPVSIVFPEGTQLVKKNGYLYVQNTETNSSIKMNEPFHGAGGITSNPSPVVREAILSGCWFDQVVSIHSWSKMED